MQITEAGIIGKIGFNSQGVGTLLNAVKVHGVDAGRMPVHFGLRLALESNSADEAVRALQGYGMAASAHILIADEKKSVGLEFTKSAFAECTANAQGRIVHTNHFLQLHADEVDTVWRKDSPFRLDTMNENASKLGSDPSWEEISRLFEDEQNLPGAICRLETEESGSGTLFNIVMDLEGRRAVVRIGRPVEAEESITLAL